ncbi:ER lumen protein-retaining receptor 3 isoform X1 [Canis aureus]
MPGGPDSKLEGPAYHLHSNWWEQDKAAVAVNSSLPCPFQTAPQAGPPSLPCLRVVGAAVMWQEGHQARPDEHGAAPERRPRDGRKVLLWLSSLDALLGVWRSFRMGLCVRPLAAIFVRWYSGGAHPLLGPGVRGDRAKSRLGGGPRRQKADAPPPPRLRGGSGSVLILEAGQGVPEKSVLWPTGHRRQGMSQGGGTVSPAHSPSSALGPPDRTGTSEPRAWGSSGLPRGGTLPPSSSQSNQLALGGNFSLLSKEYENLWSRFPGLLSTKENGSLGRARSFLLSSSPPGTWTCSPTSSPSTTQS